MPKDPAGLERLKDEYRVSEDATPFGPSIIVPNDSFRPEWTDILGRA